MADFKVTPNVLLSSQTQLNSLRSRLSAYESEIASVCSQLNFKLAAKESLRSKLNRISENVGICADYTGNMSSAIGNISGKYTDSENTIVGNEQGTNNIIPETGGSTEAVIAAAMGAGVDLGIDPDWNGLLSKVIGKFGVIGKVGQEIWNVIDDFSAMNVFKGANNIGNAIFGMLDEPDWLKLIGFNKESTSGFVDAFTDELGKKFPTDFSTGAKMGKTVTKWIGTAADVIDNGMKYGEKVNDGDMSVSEAVASTMIETGYDALIGMGASAVATAGLAALGVTAAPAVVIGAGAAAIVWGADQLVSNFTDYDSLGEAATAMTVKAGEVIMDGVSTAWDGICDFFGKSHQMAFGGGGGGAF